MEKIELQSFPIENMAYDSVITMIAKRNSGKSYLCRDILSHFSELPIGIVISRTEKSSPWFSTFMPHEFIFDEFEPSIIGNIFERQTKLIQKYGKQSWQEKGGMDSRCFILMDDCISDKKFFKDNGIREIFMNGRHMNLMYMLTTQDCMAIPSDLRTNVDYVFILRETRVNTLKKIYEHYASVIPTFDLFRYIMRIFTADYGVLVIDNKSQKQNWEDLVFYYKAENHTDLRICKGKAWKFHDKYYNKDYLKTKSNTIVPFYDKKKKCSLKIVKAKEKKKT